MGRFKSGKATIWRKYMTLGQWKNRSHGKATITCSHNSAELLLLFTSPPHPPKKHHKQIKRNKNDRASDPTGVAAEIVGMEERRAWLSQVAAASWRRSDHGTRRQRGRLGLLRKPSNQVVALFNFSNQCLQDIYHPRLPSIRSYF
jgi:hypothetical protein